MDDQVRGSGNGERMRGRYMRFEVVLHAYRHLRWDVDAISRVGHTFAPDSTTISLMKTAYFSPQPNLPIVHLLLSVRCRPLTCSG